MAKRSRSERIRGAGLIAILSPMLGSLCLAPSSAALDVDTLTGSLKTNSSRNMPAIKVDRKTQKLEDMIERQEIPYGFPPMIPMQGIAISGLGPKAVQSLGENYFVVRSNTSTIKMSDLYKDNRSAGKANYVTIDCVLHPYIAYTNRVHAETCKRYLLPLMKNLLNAMLQIALVDYKQADDGDVRSDIEGNIAFLSLGLKLLDSSFQIPQIGRVGQMVLADYDSVVFARPGFSSILDRNEDFAAYRPQGWYRTAPELVAFYRAKTWLSRLNYPINDVSFDGAGSQVNNFRRSVLLYRCLDLAHVDGKPAFDSWTRLVKGLFILGGQVESWQEKNLYPHDYKSTFRTNSTDLRMTLSALSEPLYRTKLLLAVRKQKPLSLGTTSIFDMDDQSSTQQTIAVFRLFPVVGSPEEPWMRWAARMYPRPSLNTNLFPIALLDLNSWGVPQASNFLLDSSWAMDENVPLAVTELKKWVLRRLLGGHVQAVENRFWSLLSPSWRLLPDGIQTVVRGEMWANRKMETAFCAWLDSIVSIAPPPVPSAPVRTVNSVSGSIKHHVSEGNQKGTSDSRPKVQFVKPQVPLKPLSHSNLDNSTDSILNSFSSNSPVQSSVANHKAAGAVAAGVGTAAASATMKARTPTARRASRGHFLDPYYDLYQKLEQDAQRTDKELTALGFPLEQNLKRGLEDYVRLFQRFAKIAKDELEAKPLAPADLSLLGNIDMILEKIDLPLPAVVPIQPQATFAAAKTKTAPATTSEKESAAAEHPGFTMAIGRPGLLYIILQNKATRDWTLARGAVYTYYEQYGNVTEEALLNRIDKGQIAAPYWTERFDFVQADTKK
ncbi:MAG: DUF3160 domain-containing protein [Candidatus Obscuribacterales bacterium]|nr:DUF3160 domain-containing protein [Candidatus Obscuribacterales bacterium]